MATGGKPRLHSPNKGLGRRLLRTPRALFGIAIGGAFALVAVLAPWLAPTEAGEMDIAMRLVPPQWTAGSAGWLGRDLNGESVLTSMLFGAQTSLYIALLTVALSSAVGTVIGLISGYRQGLVDMLLMRLVDILMAFPGILLAMALTALMGPSRNNVILSIAATGWTSTARLVRGQTLSIREREYVTGARALGASGLRIIARHILPGTISPLVVQATFSLSGVILVEASLSFLGLGARDGAPSWGALLAQGRTVLTEAPFLSIVPGLSIAALVLALNFLGDALRDELDPRATKTS